MKVSVIIFHKKIYNYPEHWIKQCLNSIRNQTYKKFDVFEIDYGGENNQAYEGSNFTSKIFPTHAHAHNYLLDKVFKKGYDCAFNVNVDDYYTTDRFEKMLPAIKEGYDLVSSNFIRVNQVGHIVRKFHFSNLDILEEAKKEHNVICHPSVVYSRKYWKKCDKLIPEEIPFDDFKLWKRSYEKGFKFFIVPDFTTFHRVHQDNISRKNKAV